MELQTPKELANIWRIGETKVWSLIQQGKIKRYWKGEHVAVDKADFNAFVCSNQETIKAWQKPSEEEISVCE